MPPASSHSRGGGLPCARLERDGLGDEGGEREAREQRVAERAARGDRVEGAGGVDDRVGELEAAEVPGLPTAACRRRGVSSGHGHATAPARRRRAPGRRRTAARSRSRVGDHAAEARAEPARHARLERELRRHALAPRTARAPPRASAAARRRRPRSVGVELLPEQFGDEAVIADRAVVGRDARVVAAAPRPRHARRRGTRAARGASGSVVLPDRQRRDPDPAADQQRAPADLRRRGSRARAARAATARRPRAARTAGACPGRRPRTGSRAAPSSWRRSTENARGRNGRSSAPPPQRSLAASM